VRKRLLNSSSIQFINKLIVVALVEASLALIVALPVL